MSFQNICCPLALIGMLGSCSPTTVRERGGGGTVFTNMVAVLFYLRVFFVLNPRAPGTVVVILLDGQRIKV